MEIFNTSSVFLILSIIFLIMGIIILRNSKKKRIIPENKKQEKSEMVSEKERLNVDNSAKEVNLNHKEKPLLDKKINRRMEPVIPAKNFDQKNNNINKKVEKENLTHPRFLKYTSDGYVKVKEDKEIRNVKWL